MNSIPRIDKSIQREVAHVGIWSDTDEVNAINPLTQSKNNYSKEFIWYSIEKLKLFL